MTDQKSIYDLALHECHNEPSQPKKAKAQYQAMNHWKNKRKR